MFVYFDNYDGKKRVWPTWAGSARSGVRDAFTTTTYVFVSHTHVVEEVKLSILGKPS